MMMCGVLLRSQRQLLMIWQGLQIRRFSGDPVRMESIFSFQALFPFQAGGAGVDVG